MNRIAYQMTAWDNGRMEYVGGYVRYMDSSRTQLFEMAPMSKVEQIGALAIVCKVINQHEENESRPKTTLENLIEGSYIVKDKLKLYPSKEIITDIGKTLELTYVFKLDGLEDVYGVARDKNDDTHNIVRFRV